VGAMWIHRSHEGSVLSSLGCQSVSLDGEGWAGGRRIFRQRTCRTHGIRRVDSCLSGWSWHDGFIGADFVVRVVEWRAACTVISAIAIHRSSAHVTIAVKGRRHKRGRGRSHAS
jgi:hypothetical protein